MVSIIDFYVLQKRPSKEGFDIVIGNPPYGAKISSIDKACFKHIFTSAQTIPNIQKGSLDTFSLFIDLGYQILHTKGNAIFIVPLSVTASDAMSGLHRLLINHCDEIYVSSYGDRPRRIFESAEQQVSIISFKKSSNKATRIMTTHINKRYSDESLWLLLDDLKFVNALHHIRNGRIPKIGNEIELGILCKLERCVTTIKDVYKREGLPIYYRKAGGRYYKIITKIPTHSSAEGELKVREKYQSLVGAALSSNLFYWFWLIHSDWHNLRSSELEMFPIPFESFSDEELDKINTLYDTYLNDLYSKSQTTKTGLKCFFARQSKMHIDAIDKFDRSKDVKFETYASLRIRGAILDQIRKMDWIPRAVRQKQKKIDEAIKNIEMKTGKTALDEEIASELGVSEDEYLNWQSQLKVTNVVSLNEFVEQGTEPAMDATKNSHFAQPEDVVAESELKEVLAQSLETLTEKERRVIELYYYEELTLKEISSILEVSESRISQLHTRALAKMKKKMGSYMDILVEES